MSAKKAAAKKAAKKVPARKVPARKAAKAAKKLPPKKQAAPAKASGRDSFSGHRARKKKGGKKKAAKRVVEKQPPGRPSAFDIELFKEICTRLSKGEPLTIICGEERMPCDDTVRNWADADEDLGKMLQRARDRGMDAIAYDILTIADNVGHEKEDTIDTDFGPIPNKEWILRSKLRCEMRLKLLSKWDPRRYGDKVQTEISGPGGKPVEMNTSQSVELTEEQERKILEAAAIGASLTPPGFLTEDESAEPGGGSEGE